MAIFHIEIIINVLVGSFRFIWIHMSWVYRHYKYCILPVLGIDFWCQILTSKDGPALKGLRVSYLIVTTLHIIIYYFWLQAFHTPLSLKYGCPSQTTWMLAINSVLTILTIGLPIARKHGTYAKHPYLILLCKAKRQYLLTLQVSRRYCVYALYWCCIYRYLSFKTFSAYSNHQVMLLVMLLPLLSWWASAI